MPGRGLKKVDPPIDFSAGKAPEDDPPAVAPAPAPPADSEPMVKFTVKLAESTAARFADLAHEFGRELGRHQSGPARGRPVSQADVLRAFLDAAEQDSAVMTAVRHAVAESLR